MIHYWLPFLCLLITWCNFPRYTCTQINKTPKYWRRIPKATVWTLLHEAWSSSSRARNQISQSDNTSPIVFNFKQFLNVSQNQIYEIVICLRKLKWLITNFYNNGKLWRNMGFLAKLGHLLYSTSKISFTFYISGSSKRYILVPVFYYIINMLQKFSGKSRLENI